MRYHHLLIVALAVFLGGSHYLGYTPIALGVFFFLASVVAYFLYAKDKVAAIEGSWRVSENTLHMVALLFGWPGALVAQQRLRHKTQKKSFRVFFWLTVLFNLGAIAWIHTPNGNSQLRHGVHQLESFAISAYRYEELVSATLFLTRFRT